MQWIPSKKMTEQHDATFDGQVTEIYIIDGQALPPSAIRKVLAQSDQESDDLTAAYMSGVYDGKNKDAPQRQPEQEPVAMRHDFDGYGWLYIDNGSGSNWKEKIKNAEPLYTAPPQPKPEQELVAWRNAAIRVGEDLCSVGPFGYYDMTAKQWLDWALSVVTVHAPPPQREWVGLTEEERDHLEGLHLYAARNQVEAWIEGVPSFIDAIEAKLREKNGG